ncbi:MULTISPECIES: hypothetical protein [unclassified Endozoicomonas]|nr:MULTISPECIES: hypothetical protein [unclassified Endozoicomonas]
MKITMVKKIMADGSPCKKCSEVLERLESSGHFGKIDQVLIAKEGDASSEGARLAEFYKVNKAPFFVVEEEGQEPKIYTVYFKLVKEVLNRQAA